MVIEGENLAGGFAPVAIEEDDACADLESQNIASVMRFRATEDGSVPVVRRKVKAVHEEKDEG